MKDHWSKPKPKLRFKHIEQIATILKLMYKPHKGTKPKIFEFRQFYL